MARKPSSFSRSIHSRTIALSMALVKISGSVNAGLFLSQCFFWDSITTDPDGWFYKTVKQWEEETSLSRSEQEIARRKLKSLGFIEESQHGGADRKLYFRVCPENVEGAIKRLEAQINSHAQDSADGNSHARDSAYEARDSAYEAQIPADVSLYIDDNIDDSREHILPFMETEVIFPSSPPPGPTRSKKAKSDVQPEDEEAKAMLAVFRAMFVPKGPAFTETMWVDHRDALRRAVRDGVTIECYRAACHGAKATWGMEYISPGSVARNVDRLSQYAASGGENAGNAKQTPLARSGETPFVPSLTAQKVTRDTELQMVHYTRLNEDPEYARDYYEKHPERHPDYDDGEVTAPPRDADAERYNRMATAQARGA